MIQLLKEIFFKSLHQIGIFDESVLFFETPKSEEFGDFTTNVAFKLSKVLKDNPINIAKKIIDNLESNEYISKVEIAGNGFINIYLSNEYYYILLSKITHSINNIGKNNYGLNKKVNVEYVSVNPTGLLHLGHGRNAAIGDTIAKLFEWNGYSVTKEYYFNNAGNQMNNLAKSIYARYIQLYFDNNYQFPEDGYHGEYIYDIAKELYIKYGNSLKEYNTENLLKCRKFGEEWNFNRIKSTLKRLNIIQDIYFNEDSLYSDGKISELLNLLKENNLSYEKDNAVWMSFSKIGLKEDRVIVKSTGEPTYRLPDIAYHIEKFKRGYDLLIDVFGADHIATIPDVLAAVSALGYDKDKVKVVIHQFVTLTENGEQVKMSKRTGKNYTLDDLLDEVGEDVVRFFLIMRGVSTHLEFDLGLAKEQSDKNPVFYLQYAHARICSILQTLKENNYSIDESIHQSNLRLLVQPSEIRLIKYLLKMNDITKLACDKLEPMILADYLRELAASFHAFYHDCRIINSEANLMKARVLLLLIVKQAIFNGLSILGISAPEKM